MADCCAGKGVHQLRKIMIFGNSGSGKSTLAKKLIKAEGLSHLDLDSLAWLPEVPPQRAPLAASKKKIKHFVNDCAAWVIEGCYADLLEIAAPLADEIIFMNISVAECVENAKARPWEPHKYASKKAQDDNLAMLIDWIKQYRERDDVFSFRSHFKFYDEFLGKKTMITCNETKLEISMRD